MALANVRRRIPIVPVAIPNIPLTPPDGHEPYVHVTQRSLSNNSLIARPPLILDVEYVMLNSFEGLGVLMEDDWGRMLYSQLEDAMNVASGYFRFRPGAGLRTYVRVGFTGLRFLGEAQTTGIISDTRHHIGTVLETANSLYHTLNAKYHQDLEFSVNKDRQGSGGNLALDNTLSYTFVMTYSFNFVLDDPNEEISPIRHRIAYSSRINDAGPLPTGSRLRSGAAPVAPKATEMAETPVRALNRNERRRGLQRYEPGMRVHRSGNVYARPEAAVPRGIGIGNTQGETIYSRLKAQIYIKRTLGDIFEHSKAAISTPESEDLFCFPMAFLRCQKRSWTWEEGKPTHVNEDSMVTLPFTQDFEIPANALASRSAFINQQAHCINVFCNNKLQIGRGLYANEATTLNAAAKLAWLWAAFQLHCFVENIWDGEVDPHDLGLCLQAYSYAFDVHISIFAVEQKGERIHFQRPHRNAGTGTDSFVAMLLQGEHLHAVSNMRHYQKSECNAHGTCVHSYCDYCNTIAYNRKADYKHQVKCLREDKWSVPASLAQLHEDDMFKSEGKRRYHFLKGDKATADMCIHCKHLLSSPGTSCQCRDITIASVQVVCCITCGCSIPRNHFNNHNCFMPPKKELDALDNASIFVYDIESAQDFNEDIGQYVHECILVCLRAVYDDRRWRFSNIAEFTRFLIDNEFMHGSVILAHNGGGYDHQFVLRFLEDNGIMHATVPRPNTLHKYLMVKITMGGPKTEIRFLDFMMMMTDSLKNIGKAFNLEACKGDFPHRFSRRENLNYSGPLPDPNSEEDYYGFKNVKSASELVESKQYWAEQQAIYCECRHGNECTCGKPPWVFQDQLFSYCEIDVDVLAGACKAYRDEALAFSGTSKYEWEAYGVDPFNYMTQSQIALALFTRGKTKRDILITHERRSPGFRPNQLKWMEYLMYNNPEYQIQHAGNSFKEFYDVDGRFDVDGYCPKTRTVFEYKDCYTDACPTCYAAEIAGDEKHPTRNTPWKAIHKFNNRAILSLRQNNLYQNVVIHWSHDDAKFDNFHMDERYTDIMKMRDIFYGGRTEVFSSYCKPEKMGMEIRYEDVCSLYPYVCSFKELPIGIPEVFYYNSIDTERMYPTHKEPYFGFVRLRIRPCKTDLIGVLPERIEGKLMYTLEEKEGVWHTEFIRLALERGYTIIKVFEVWHWGPTQRSSTVMRGYMEFFLRMKQEADGWLKLGKDIYSPEEIENRTPEVTERILDYIENNNGKMARPRGELVAKNPVKRQLAKIFLNCLWGKLSQKSASEFERFIYGYRQYLELMANPLLDMTSLKFRHVNGGVYKVRYRLINTLEETSNTINVPMAASVTAHAQVLLMRQMFVVGPERILYCDTDSIIYLRKSTDIDYAKSGLGNWENECPGRVISRFLALAPKCYEIKYEGEEEGIFKCKGVRSTDENRKLVSSSKLFKLVQSTFLYGVATKEYKEAYKAKEAHDKSKLSAQDLEALAEGEEDEGYAAASKKQRIHDHAGRVLSSDALEMLKADWVPLISAETMTIHSNSVNAQVPYGTLLTRYGHKDIQTVYSKRILVTNQNPGVISLDQMGLVRLLPKGYEGNETHIYLIN